MEVVGAPEIDDLTYPLESGALDHLAAGAVVETQNL